MGHVPVADQASIGDFNMKWTLILASSNIGLKEDDQILVVDDEGAEIFMFKSCAKRLVS